MPTKTRRKNRPTKPIIPQFQKTIKPGDDFYKYVNGEWLRHVNMPPYLSSYGISEEIEEQIDEEIMTILNQSRDIIRVKADKNIPHTVYLLGTLVESALNSKTQDLNVSFLKDLVVNLRCIRDANDIGSTIGDFIKYRISTVLGFIVVPPETNSKSLKLALTPGSLGLPDPSYYQNINTRVINAYSKLLKRLSIDFNVPNLETSIATETILAEALIESRGDYEIIIKGKELKKKYFHIPWDKIFEATMIPSSDSLDIIIFSDSWLSAINKWFRTFTLDQWKLLLSLNLLMSFLPLLPPPYDDMEFELFGHRLKGQSEKIPQKRLALRLAEQWLTGSLGDLFVKKYVSSSIKHNATSITKEIQQVAKERVGDIDWLEEDTKKKAQRKIQNIYLGVAYPETIEKDKKTMLNPERLLENVLKLSNLDFKDEMSKINEPLKREKWDDPVFAVNAYYYNEGNRLILPAGILRWPFFSNEASDGWNFGGLGATIGHEICHAFDNDGKEYDEFGNRNIWWNKSEQLKYRKKANKLVELFDNTEYFGHHLNGALTLSENIADLGGLAISLAALKKRLKNKNTSAQETRKQLCEFFTSFAISWRTKEKKEKAMQSLFMDVHAPPSARVNNIVCQFDDWYECFDVKPGDELYKASSERIRIF